MMRTTRGLRAVAAAGTPLFYKTLWGVPDAFCGDVKQWRAMLTNIRDYGQATAPADAAAAHSARSHSSGRPVQFAGVEVCTGPFFPFTTFEQDITKVAQELGLGFIMQVHTCGYPVPPAFGSSHKHNAGKLFGNTGYLQPPWKEHADSLRFQAETAVGKLRLPDAENAVAGDDDAVAFSPIHVFNVHGGKDSLRRDDMLRFLEAAAVVERDVGVTMCHETHRQRILHDPFVLLALRDDLPPTLKLNADLSHFVVALERVMCDENDGEFWPEVLTDILCRRTGLLHARVGTPQSPQLDNPTPYYAEQRRELQLPAASALPDAPATVFNHEVARHVAWWRQIADGMRERGVPVRVVPEYGPQPYQHVDGTAAQLDQVVGEAAGFLAEALAEKK
jgi:hypothetical protein